MSRISTEALAQSATALQRGDVRAAMTVRDRENGQSGGAFDDSIVSTIEHILGSTPALLLDCPAQVLEPLRIAAAMMELWGTNSIRNFVTIEGELDYRFGTDAVAALPWQLFAFTCRISAGWSFKGKAARRERFGRLRGVPGRRRKVLCG